MKVRKTLAIAALGLVALSACGKSENVGAASASSSPQAVAMTPDEAKSTVLAAALKITTTAFKTRITFDSGLAKGSTIEASYDAVGKRLQMTMTVQGQAMEARQIGTDMYMLGMIPGAPTGKWVHMDLDQVLGGADALGTPEQSLALLNGVTEVTANPDGTFSGKADPALAMQKAPDLQKANMEKVVKAAKGQLVPFTATVKDGLLTEYGATLPIEQNGVVVETTMSMHLYDLGQPVTVEAPAKADVIEVTDLTKR